MGKSQFLKEVIRKWENLEKVKTPAFSTTPAGISYIDPPTPYRPVCQGRKPPPPKGNEKSPGLPGLNSLHLEIHRLSSLVAVMTIEVYGPLNQGTNFGGIDIVDGDHTAKSLLDKELGFITTLTLKHITSE